LDTYWLVNQVPTRHILIGAVVGRFVGTLYGWQE